MLSMMMAMAAFASVICRAASMPFRFGIPISITITSGLSDSAMATAWRPSSASPTTTSPGCRSITSRSPLRISL